MIYIELNLYLRENPPPPNQLLYTAVGAVLKVQINELRILEKMDQFEDPLVLQGLVHLYDLKELNPLLNIKQSGLINLLAVVELIGVLINQLDDCLSILSVDSLKPMVGFSSIH